jgi:hypothetical protein
VGEESQPKRKAPPPPPLKKAPPPKRRSARGQTAEQADDAPAMEVDTPASVTEDVEVELTEERPKSGRRPPPADRKRRREATTDSEKAGSPVDKGKKRAKTEEVEPSPIPPTPAEMDGPTYKKWKSGITLLLQQIANDSEAGIFAVPVLKRDAPNYHQLIKQPMDIRTVGKRLKDGSITTTAAFRRDMLLIFANAIMFNPPGTDVANSLRRRWSRGVPRNDLQSLCQSTAITYNAKGDVGVLLCEGVSRLVRSCVYVVSSQPLGTVARGARRGLDPDLGDFRGLGAVGCDRHSQRIGLERRERRTEALDLEAADAASEGTDRPIVLDDMHDLLALGRRWWSHSSSRHRSPLVRLDNDGQLRLLRLLRPLGRPLRPRARRRLTRRDLSGGLLGALAGGGRVGVGLAGSGVGPLDGGALLGGRGEDLGEVGLGAPELGDAGHGLFAGLAMLLMNGVSERREGTHVSGRVSIEMVWTVPSE